MRAILVFLVLALLYVLVRASTDFEFGLAEANPFLLGYGAIFAAGLVAAELMRPILSLLSPTSRFVTVAVIAALTWVTLEEARRAGDNPDVLIQPEALAKKVDEDETKVRLSPAWDGIYRAVAQLNYRSLGVIVDIGTPVVLMQFEEAERFGLQPELLKYTKRVAVGDRKITSAPYTFVSIRIDGIELLDVKGAIAEPGALETTIIGLSFLNRLGVAGLVDGDLLLRQKVPGN